MDAEKQSQSFVDEYVDWASAFTHSPEIFHNFTAYWLLATALRNKIWIRQGSFKVYPNLWMILVAKSSWFAKTTAMRIGQNMLEKVASDVIYADDFSQENLYKNLAKQPQGSFYFSEFASFMKLVEREYNSGLKSFLTDLYDCPPRRKRTVGVKDEREYIIENPVINIIASTTLNWFADSIKDHDLFSGFLARFLFIPAYTQEKFYPRLKMPDREKEKIIVENLQIVLDIHGEMRFTTSAGTLYDSLCNSFYEKYHLNGSICSPFYMRLITYSLKFCMLNSVLNHHFPDIHDSDVESAWQIVRRLTREMSKIVEYELTFTTDQSQRKKVLEIIKDKHPAPTTFSELLRRTRLKTADLREALLSLEQADHVTSETPKGEQGRPVTLYKYTPDPFQIDPTE